MWRNVPGDWSDMSDEERKDAAYAKGQHDYKSSGGLEEILWSSYDPPDGYQDEYSKGWNNVKNQR